MKYCANCGKEIADGYLFCAACGEPADTARSDEASIAEERECLDGFYRFFKYERIAWKVGGIIFLVIALLFGGLGLIFSLSTIGYDSYDMDTAALGVGLGIAYLLYGLIFLPVAIVCLKMVKKTEYYMNTLYTDVVPLIKRCNSVGMIVLAAFFNEIALIFIIINFVRAKTNKALLARIAQRQREFKSNQSVNV